MPDLTLVYTLSPCGAVRVIKGDVAASESPSGELQLQVDAAAAKEQGEELAIHLAAEFAGARGCMNCLGATVARQSASLPELNFLNLNPGLPYPLLSRSVGVHLSEQHRAD